MMGIKECTCCDEHQVLYGSVELLYCTPETNITLYVNYTGIIFFKDFIYLLDRDSQQEREHKQGEWERKKRAPNGEA